MDKKAKLKNKIILKIFKLFNNGKISNSDRDKENKAGQKTKYVQLRSGVHNNEILLICANRSSISSFTSVSLKFFVVFVVYVHARILHYGLAYLTDPVIFFPLILSNQIKLALLQQNLKCVLLFGLVFC